MCFCRSLPPSHVNRTQYHVMNGDKLNNNNFLLLYDFRTRRSRQGERTMCYNYYRCMRRQWQRWRQVSSMLSSNAGRGRRKQWEVNKTQRQAYGVIVIPCNTLHSRCLRGIVSQQWYATILHARCRTILHTRNTDTLNILGTYSREAKTRSNTVVVWTTVKRESRADENQTFAQNNNVNAYRE